MLGLICGFRMLLAWGVREPPRQQAMGKASEGSHGAQRSLTPRGSTGWISMLGRVIEVKRGFKRGFVMDQV